MSDPIEYWNPNGRSEPAPADPRYAPAAAGRPLKAVPVEFDSLLTRTTELAAAQAIVNALTKLGIPFHQADDGRIADREILLYVRSTDQTRAATLAAEIFVRRKKIRSFPRPKPVPNSGLTNGLDSIAGIL
jgi:hypothetical protein